MCGDVCVCKGMNDLRHCKLHCSIQELFLKSERFAHQIPTDNEGVLIPILILNGVCGRRCPFEIDNVAL